MNNELIKRLSSSSALINMLPEYPDYNGSAFVINDVKAERIVKDINDAVAALTQQQEAEPVAWVDEEGRVVRVSEDGSGDGGWVSGHDRAIPDSWTPLHPPKPAALPQVPEGIIKIERKFEYFSPVTAPKVVVYFAPDDWEAQDRFALWLSAAKEGK